MGTKVGNRRARYVGVHLIMVLSAWLPDLVPVLRIRGWVVGRLLASCGTDFQVCSGARFLAPDRIIVGKNVYVGHGCWIQGFGGVALEDEVMLGPYTVLASSNHTRRGSSYRFGEPRPGPIRFGIGAWTGSHVTVTAGVSVGAGAACAAGSVVTSDVPPDVVVGGVPAKALRDMREPEASKGARGAKED